jgi:hypothetical protein
MVTHDTAMPPILHVVYTKILAQDLRNGHLVIRVCTGVLLAFTLHVLVQSARECLERQPTSDCAAAARPRQEVTFLAAPFERWQRQVPHSLRSRAYFVQILRPCLLALWEHQRRARGASDLSDVEPEPLSILWHEPPRQLLPGRGIALRKLQALVQALEERS